MSGWQCQQRRTSAIRTRAHHAMWMRKIPEKLHTHIPHDRFLLVSDVFFSFASFMLLINGCTHMCTGVFLLRWAQENESWRTFLAAKNVEQIQMCVCAKPSQRITDVPLLIRPHFSVCLKQNRDY